MRLKGGKFNIKKVLITGRIGRDESYLTGLI